MKNRYKMTISYEGTAYAGWQIQPRHRTIQSELERVLKELVRSKVRIHGSGRTDRGVHARAQVAHFDLAAPLIAAKLLGGMNALLDADIRVMRLGRAPADFHARLSAVGKEYRYLIHNGPILPPFVRNVRTWVREDLDVEAMRKAARHLEGKKDFAAFSANPNREVEGTVRHLQNLTVRKRGSELCIVARGDGFLYKMVRSLAGFLLRVGRGDLSPGTARDILDSGTRTATVPTAPPQGLFLWKVYY
jgi:tRNA pseudouridine38-40 synthase